MEQNNTNYQVNGDEISLKELIIKLQEYGAEIIKKWWLIGLFSVFGVGAFLYKHYTHEVNYFARLKFVVEGQSGVGSGLGSLLGSFGMGGKLGKVNPYKILEVAHGSELFLKVLRTKGESGEMLANEILDVYDLQSVWAESNPIFEDFRFDSLASGYGNDVVKQTAIKKLHRLIWGSESDRSNALSVISFSDDTGVYFISSNTRSESLSLDLTNTLYKEIKFFFEEELFADQARLADILKQKSDSLQVLRNFKVRELARFEDRNRAIIGKQMIAERSIISMEQMALNAAYGEILKTREMTDINMKDQKPLFVAVDSPFKPLFPDNSSFVQKTVLGVVVGSFIAILFIIFGKIYKDTMSE